MKKLNKQVIAHVGTSLNKVNFSEDCLKDCVNNINTESLPVINQFNRNNVIGCMTNFEYKDGKIFADIQLFDDIYPDLINKIDDGVFRCSYEVKEKTGKDPIKIKECIIRDSALIDKKDDPEKKLRSDNE